MEERVLFHFFNKNIYQFIKKKDPDQENVLKREHFKSMIEQKNFMLLIYP